MIQYQQGPAMLQSSNFGGGSMESQNVQQLLPCLPQDYMITVSYITTSGLMANHAPFKGVTASIHLE
jgi:hypothetical protein